MTVPQELKAKYPHATAVLRFRDIPSPRWFNSNGPSMDAVVCERGVFAHGDFLSLIEGMLPPVGTSVKLMFERDLLFVEEKTKYEERATRERHEAQERRAESNRLELSDQEARAVAANGTLNIPVRWTSGEKTVLSGLQAGGWGNGRNRRSVNHVLLLEAVSEGRFSRDADTFLCTSASGTDGQMWTGCLSTYSHGNDGKYVSRIDCSGCLRLAARWKDPAKRVEPELAGHDLDEVRPVVDH